MSIQEFPRAERARRLRSQAEELHDRAAQARDPEVRLTYLELARSWSKTAERVEGRDETSAANDDTAKRPPTLTS